MAALTERLMKAEKLATKVWKENQDKKGGGFFKRCMQGLEEVLCEAAMCMDTLRIVQKFKKTDSGAPLTQEYVDGKLCRRRAAQLLAGADYSLACFGTEGVGHA